MTARNRGCLWVLLMLAALATFGAVVAVLAGVL